MPDEKTSSERGRRLLAFLSEEWLAERRQASLAVPGTAGATMTIQHVVLGGPDGPVHYVDKVQDGRVEDCYLGADDQAEVTITNIWHDEIAVMRGEADPFDIIMEGRIRVTGDQALLLRVIPVLQHPVTERMARELAEITLA